MDPVTLANTIRDCADRLENSARVIASTYEEFTAAKREFSLALAEHRQASTGSFQDRTDAAQLHCKELWLIQDTAEAKYKYARDLANALEKKLSGLQTEAKLLMGLGGL
jgi:hypothetical protein